MHRCGESLNNGGKLKHRSWHIIIVFAMDDMRDAHPDGLCVFWLTLPLKLGCMFAYFIEECRCITILRIIAFNGSTIGDRWLVFSVWIVNTNCSYTNCMSFDYPSVTNSVLSMCTWLRNAQCGESANYGSKLKHRSWHMIIVFAVDDMRDPHLDNLCVFWLSLRLKLRFIFAHFIEECRCITILWIIAFNRSVISDRWLAIPVVIVSTNCSYINCMCFDYPLVTNSVLVSQGTTLHDKTV